MHSPGWPTASRRQLLIGAGTAIAANFRARLHHNVLAIAPVSKLPRYYLHAKCARTNVMAPLPA
jgi:hypothetical protein